jgi:NAD(P)-dependent dehydrogenase (short-subunit alcohol dehydrogenase family)
LTFTYTTPESQFQKSLSLSLSKDCVPNTLFITGASGIAAETARLAASRGANIFLLSKDAAECEALCRELPSADLLAGQVQDEMTVNAAVSACVKRFSEINGAFNAAGFSGRSLGDGPLHECTTPAWNTLLDVHASGTFFVCRAIIQHWLATKSAGSILNMSSVLAHFPERDHFATTAYPASKGAVESMTLAAAAYYAPLRIRLNVLAPGLVRTPMSARAQTDSQIMNFIAKKQPASQGLIGPADLARIACFLLSDESQPMTGEIIRADGGWAITG